VDGPLGSSLLCCFGAHPRSHFWVPGLVSNPREIRVARPALGKLGDMGSTLGGIERIALWMAYSRRCAYCGEPIQFRELEVDHIIPASFETDPQKLGQLRSELALPLAFALNSLGNFLPSHGGCNSRKSDLIFQPARLRYFLEIAESKVGAVRRLIPGLELQAQKERLLASVRLALESGNINFSDLVEIASEVKAFPLTARIEFEVGDWDGSTDPQEIGTLLDKPVSIGSIPKSDGVRFVSANGGAIVVRTCREFRVAMAAKYRPADNTQLKMSFFLMRASALIEAASRARLAAVSYLNSPHVGLADLDFLPGFMLPWVSDEQKRRVEELSISSLQSLLSAGEISIRSISSNHLDVSIGGLGVSLRELIRADLDGDGNEEVLVQHTVYAVQGTFRHYTFGLLRRYEPDGRFSYEDWSATEESAQVQREFHLERASR
jgi:5-methylcytosine-specific restriction endonuclease McrA